MSLTDTLPTRILLAVWWTFFWRFALATIGLAAALGAFQAVTRFAFHLNWYVGALSILRQVVLTVELVPASMWGIWSLLRTERGAFTLQIGKPEEHFS